MRVRRKDYSDRDRFPGIAALTVAVVLFLSVFIGLTIRSVNRKVMESCFSELADTSRRLAESLYRSVETDRTILAAMGEIISWPDEINEAEVCRILGSYKTEASYISYVELLRPDNTMLDADGTVRDVSAAFDFSREVARGSYISGIERSTLDSEEPVVRSAIPVFKDGEAVCVLYGVVRLSELAERYTADIYEGRAYVYVEDGDTGDFLLDTWHKTLGNIVDLGKRKTLPGYDIEDAIEKMRNGERGEIGFVSQTTGTVLYMHYEPIGVNNWNVLITVEQEYALRKSRSVSTSLYRMAGVIGAIMLLYVVCVSVSLLATNRQVRRLGAEDQNTGLQNRNAYDKYAADHAETLFGAIVCVYVDVNGLHDLNNRLGHAAGDQMLRAVAKALKAGFDYPSVYRVGGDEFVVIREEDDEEPCREKMRRVVAQVEAQGYHIAYGIACRQAEKGVERVTREADALMLADKRAYYTLHDRRRRP